MLELPQQLRKASCRSSAGVAVTTTVFFMAANTGIHLQNLVCWSTLLVLVHDSAALQLGSLHETAHGKTCRHSAAPDRSAQRLLSSRSRQCYLLPQPAHPSGPLDHVSEDDERSLALPVDLMSCRACRCKPLAVVSKMPWALRSISSGDLCICLAPRRTTGRHSSGIVKNLSIDLAFMVGSAQLLDITEALYGGIDHLELQKWWNTSRSTCAH